MSRAVGTVVRGLRTPIFTENDNLLDLVPDILIKASQIENFEFNDGDILAITESVLARTQGNYVSVADIAAEVKSKLNGSRTVGLTFPILSRNRFASLLEGMAKAVDEVIIQLSYPADEVGNHLFDANLLYEKNINPWQDVLTEQQFLDIFGTSKHPFTGIDYVALYKSIVEQQGATCTILFSNDIREILKHTKTVICCDIHTRKQSKRILKAKDHDLVLGLDDLMNEPSEHHGYNPEYGLLGSNKASTSSVKLFPRDSQLLVDRLAKILYERTQKRIEVMVYGDGAFKDPIGKIWELADPVVSPAYTDGLKGTPEELKIKYLADNEFGNLNKEQQEAAIKERLKNKEKRLDAEAAVGTTPRHIPDLLGSLADLTSGSGDKGTPLVFIQGYFDNYSEN